MIQGKIIFRESSKSTELRKNRVAAAFDVKLTFNGLQCRILEIKLYNKIDFFYFLELANSCISPLCFPVVHKSCHVASYDENMSRLQFSKTNLLLKHIIQNRIFYPPIYIPWNDSRALKE